MLSRGSVFQKRSVSLPSWWNLENRNARPELLGTSKHVYPEFVQWIAPSEKDAANDALEKTFMGSR
jgi:hypothetical protein